MRVLMIILISGTTILGQSLQDFIQFFGQTMEDTNSFHLMITTKSYEYTCSSTPAISASTRIMKMGARSYVESDLFKHLVIGDRQLILSKPGKSMIYNEGSSKMRESKNALMQIVNTSYSTLNEDILSISKGVLGDDVIFEIECAPQVKAKTVTFTFNRVSRLLTKFEVIYNTDYAAMYGERNEILLTYSGASVDDLPDLSDFIVRIKGQWQPVSALDEYSLIIQ